MTRGFLVGAALLLASTASAQAPNAVAHGKDHAADKAKGADEKTAKPDDKAGERAARKAKEHEAQKTQLSATLKTPANDALKEELRRHAERVARIERVKSVATDAKDAESGARATKLLAKENARHDRWMEKYLATPTAAPAAPAARPTKEGAK